MKSTAYCAGGMSASPPYLVEKIDGHHLAVILRTLDNAGRMNVARQIAGSRLELVELTPAQICDLCHVPTTHRQHVRSVAQRGGTA